MTFSASLPDSPDRAAVQLIRYFRNVRKSFVKTLKQNRQLPADDRKALAASVESVTHVVECLIYGNRSDWTRQYLRDWGDRLTRVGVDEAQRTFAARYTAAVEVWIAGELRRASAN